MPRGGGLARVEAELLRQPVDDAAPARVEAEVVEGAAKLGDVGRAALAAKVAAGEEVDSELDLLGEGQEARAELGQVGLEAPGLFLFFSGEKRGREG